MDNSTNTPASTPTPPTNTPTFDLQAELTAAIQNCGGSVRAAYLAAKVNEEITRRTTLLTKLIDLLGLLKKALNKIKATPIGYSPTGEPILQLTPDQFANRKKLTELIEKISTQIDVALSKNDYTDADKLLQAGASLVTSA
jgi:hypothetical protein